MGKAKKRSLHKGINDRFSQLSREKAVLTVVEMLNSGNQEAYGLITLFGLTAEEILEGGASYETVLAMGYILK